MADENKTTETNTENQQTQQPTSEPNQTSEGTQKENKNASQSPQKPSVSPSDKLKGVLDQSKKPKPTEPALKRIKDEEAKLLKERQELDAYKGEVEQYKDFVKMLKENPKQALARYNIDPAKLQKGEVDPTEPLKEKYTELEQKVAQFEKEKEQKEQERLQQEYVSELQEHLDTMEDDFAKHLPNAAGVIAQQQFKHYEETGEWIEPENALNTIREETLPFVTNMLGSKSVRDELLPELMKHVSKEELQEYFGANTSDKQDTSNSNRLTQEETNTNGTPAPGMTLAEQDEQRKQRSRQMLKQLLSK